jgi:ATP-dependent Clp protease adapter protein ClpS
MVKLILHNDNKNQRFRVLTKLIDILRIDDIDANLVLKKAEENGTALIKTIEVESALDVVAKLRYGTTKLNVDISV